MRHDDEYFPNSPLLSPWYSSMPGCGTPQARRFVSLRRHLGQGLSSIRSRIERPANRRLQLQMHTKPR